MNVKYKISYLSDGTKVKITNQLFSQLKKWEEEDVAILPAFLDELKIQDNNWINSTRNYYIKTVAMQSLPHQALNKEKSLRTNNFQISSDNRVFLSCIISKLTECTATQKRRFLLHYYYGFSYKEIGELEGVSKFSIRNSVQKAIEILTNGEQFEK